MNVSKMQRAAPVASAPLAKPSKYAAGCSRKGRIDAPMRIVVFGVEGVGKSTFAAGAPSPIWLGADKGTEHLDVDRLPQPESWEEIIEAIRFVDKERDDVKTLVIDPLGWIEPLIHDKCCRDKGWKTIDDPELYNRGPEIVVDYWRTFVKWLETLQEHRAMHVILVAHSETKNERSPDTETFQRYVMQLRPKSAAVIRQWADYVLFAREPVWTTAGKDKRARGVSSGAPVLQTRWNAAYDAKSRPQLPNPLPLSWRAFVEARKDATSRATELASQFEAIAGEIGDGEAVTKARAYLAEDPTDVSRLEEVVTVLSAELAKKQEG